MQTQTIKITQVKTNPDNPRIIKDDKFKSLVKSIKEFPKMLNIRPIVLDDNNVILAGNMRFRACQEAGLKEVPVIILNGFTEKEQREFVIKDNVNFGEWDWEVLSNEWDEADLKEWGLDIPTFNEGVDIDDFFEDVDEVKVGTNKIVLEYNDEDYAAVMGVLNNVVGSKEQYFFKLMGLC